ncbi:hypothetical protein BDZ94DRAFT_1267801 [Collybia nuda]|uniref:Uncharacterized protein n=1 Tax=Collybia nuda TaxID=64659 RepID=A0A9P6CG59_9AGAR|nr:hypothetical protein BDZ94DRAFT_1267801 [Collybia nuda]
MSISCVTMSGARPNFYLVKELELLNKALITGQCPAMKACPLRCTTMLAHECRVMIGVDDVE